MEFGLRDWLLILGPVFIVGVLLHGYWRMRSSRGNLKMALDKSFLNSRHDSRMDIDDLELFRAELPNGGARVVSQPRQEALDLDVEIPVRAAPVAGAAQQTPNFKAKTSITERMPARRKAEKIEPTIGIESDLELEPEPELKPEAEPELKPKVSVDAETPVQKAPTMPRPSADCPEKFLVLYVSARHKDFGGNALLTCLQQQNMTFGDMNIYHRLDSQGRSLFSLVNAVEPGAFDPDRMHEFKTPAVSLFMRAHEMADPIAVYHQMLGLAEHLATHLDGVIRDEERKPLTRHAMERYQEDLQAFVDTYFH